MNDRDDVERLSDCGRRSSLCCRSNRRFQHVDGRTAIALLQIGTTKPSQGREPGRIIRKGITDQTLVARGRFAPTPVPLCELCLFDQCLYCAGFHLARARSGIYRHDEARMVRRTEPSSRSFLVRVGREIPRMRAAALKFPPVKPIVVWIASSTMAWSDFPSAGILITPPPAGVSMRGT